MCVYVPKECAHVCHAVTVTYIEHYPVEPLLNLLQTFAYISSSSRQLLKHNVDS